MLCQLKLNFDVCSQVYSLTIACCWPKFYQLCYPPGLFVKAMPQPMYYALHQNLTVSSESAPQDHVALHS